MFTHFATADSANTIHAHKQLQRFTEVRSTLVSAGFIIPMTHAAASAAIMSMPDSYFDMVRPGICMYGLDPSSEFANTFEIHPAMTIKSRICRLLGEWDEFIARTGRQGQCAG